MTITAVGADTATVTPSDAENNRAIEDGKIKYFYLISSCGCEIRTFRHNLYI